MRLFWRQAKARPAERERGAAGAATGAWRAGAATAAGLLLWLTACEKPRTEKSRSGADQAVPVTLGRVVRVPLDRKLAVVGTLFPKDEALVSAEVEGRVEKTLAEIGDALAVGQELAQIDTALYEVQAELAAANLAKAQANLAQAEANLKRSQVLRQEQVSSVSDLDLATAQAGQWRAEVRAQEAARAMARLNLSRSRVKAPFAGSVAERLINTGDHARVGTPLFRLVNDRELKLTVQAPERYAGQVQSRQPVQFHVDAFPNETFTGQVYYVSPSVHTSSRAFEVAALVPNADRRLKASSFARGELLLARDVPTLVVPLAAVLNFAGVTKVFVVESNVAWGRAVTVGKIQNGRQEVLEGLRAGEEVVLSGQTKLFDGAKVRRLDADGGGPRPSTASAQESKQP